VCLKRPGIAPDAEHSSPNISPSAPTASSGLEDQELTGEHALFSQVFPLEIHLPWLGMESHN